MSFSKSIFVKYLERFREWFWNLFWKLKKEKVWLKKKKKSEPARASPSGPAQHWPILPPRTRPSPRSPCSFFFFSFDPVKNTNSTERNEPKPNPVKISTESESICGPSPLYIPHHLRIASAPKNLALTPPGCRNHARIAAAPAAGKPQRRPTPATLSPSLPSLFLYLVTAHLLDMLMSFFHRQIDVSITARLGPPQTATPARNCRRRRRPRGPSSRHLHRLVALNLLVRSVGPGASWNARNAWCRTVTAVRRRSP